MHFCRRWRRWGILCLFLRLAGPAAPAQERAAPLATATPLTYSVSWIGNTFSGGDAGWVPQDVQDIFVTPDGTMYTTVGWEEHRGNIAAFQDGRLLQQTAHWKRGGIDRLVGETITANSNHIFFATGKSGPGDHDGPIGARRRSRAVRDGLSLSVRSRRSDHDG